jgi:dTDP-4-dehydrorhamnose 3,5-epimerase
MKIISCLKGEVFDVAVDLRPKSNTYLNWHAEILSADNFKTLRNLCTGCVLDFV